MSSVAKGDPDPHRRGCRRGILPDLEGLRHRAPPGTLALARPRGPGTRTAVRSREHRGRRRVRRARRRSRRTTARAAVESSVGNAHARARSRRGCRWRGLARLARVARVVVPSTVGWWAGGGSRGPRVGRRVVTAFTVAALFIVPTTILAVGFAPALVLGTQRTGDALAADRLSTLETAPAMTVFSATALGALRTVVGASRRVIAICVQGGPLGAAVGARLTARRAARLGPTATVGVGSPDWSRRKP